MYRVWFGGSYELDNDGNVVVPHKDCTTLDEAHEVAEKYRIETRYIAAIELI